MLQWLSSKWLEVSGLSLRAKIARIVKYVALILTIVKLVTSSSELRSHWLLASQQMQALNLLDAKDARRALDVLRNFVSANGGLLFGVTFTLLSKLIDARLSKSILRTTYDYNFYDRRPFDDIEKQLSGNAPGEPRVAKFGAASGWTDPKINRHVLQRADRNDTIPYQVRSGRWLAYDPADTSQKSPKGYLRSYVIAKAWDEGQHVFNGDKVRLCNDLNSATIELQETDYLSSMMTDAVAFRSITSATDPPITYSDGANSFLLAVPNGPYRLRSLSDTKSSNQLGASTLAFTSDGYIPLIYQTRHNAHSGRMIAPSGSGSFDWKDVQAVKSQNLLDLVRYAAAREVLEETGALGYTDLTVAQVASQYILPYAFARLIHRGGKPEFFCLACLPLTMRELQKRKPRRIELIYTEKLFAHDASCLDQTRDLKSQLLRICDHYSSTTHFFANETVARSFALSYQVLHGLALLKEALADAESSPLILRFLLTHFSNRSAPIAG